LLRIAIKQSEKIHGLSCPNILGDSKKTSAKIANQALMLIEEQKKPSAALSADLLISLVPSKSHNNKNFLRLGL